MQILQIR